MTAGKVKVRVCDGWGVYDGQRQHSGGEVVDVPADLARKWIAAGWVVMVEPKAHRKST